MQGDGSPRAAISRDFGVNLVWILGDAVVWVSAVLVTIWSRLEFAPSSAAVLDALLLALIAASVHVGAGLLLGPYLVPHLRGSFEEVTSLARAAAIAGAFLVLLATATNDVLFLPRSSPFLSTAMAVTLMLAGRVTVRAYRARHTPCNPDANRVIILGAGESGRSVVRALRQADTPDLVPVGLLDDDRRKRRLVIDGLPVAGDRTMMSQLAVRTGATHLAVAIPSATSELLRDIQDQADAAGLKVKVRRRADEWLRSEDACAVDLGTLTWRISSGAVSSSSTSRALRNTSPARSCSSLGRVARSALSCAVRSSGSIRRGWRCWIVTSRRCTPPS